MRRTRVTGMEELTSINLSLKSPKDKLWSNVMYENLAFEPAFSEGNVEVVKALGFGKTKVILTAFCGFFKKYMGILLISSKAL